MLRSENNRFTTPQLPLHCAVHTYGEIFKKHAGTYFYNLFTSYVTDCIE